MGEYPFEIYTLKQALVYLKKHNNIFKSIKDIYQIAQEGKIKLSYHNPDWKYLRVDEKDCEFSPLECKPLNEWFIVPNSRRSTGTGGYASQFWGSERHIFPFISVHQIDLEFMEKGYLYVSAWHLFAEYKGENIKVAKIGYKRFPEKGEQGYDSFTAWLLFIYPMVFNLDGRVENPKPPIDTSRYFSENFFFTLPDGWLGKGTKISVKDLCITKKELVKFIDSGNQEKKKSPEFKFKNNTVDNKKSNRPSWVKVEEGKSGIGVFFAASIEAFWSEKARTPRNTEELRKWLINNKDNLSSFECMNGYNVKGGILDAGLEINGKHKSKMQIEQSCKRIIEDINNDKFI
jgi:hypothetical protein